MTDGINNDQGSQEGVNSGLQSGLTPDQKKLLDDLAAQKARDEAEKKKRESREAFLKQVKDNTGEDAWKALASVKDKSGKTIEDLFNEKPHLLDEPAMTASAIDIFKTIAETNSNSNSQGDPEQRGAGDSRPADPSNPSAGGGDYVPPSDVETFLKDVMAGKVSKEDIVKSKLGKTEQLMLMRLQGQQASQSQNAASKFF